MSASLSGMDPAATYRAKRALVAAGLATLGVAYELLSKHSPEMKRETASWKEGFSFSLGVLPRGPLMTVRKEGNHLRYLGRGGHDAPLQIWIKNVDSAVRLLTGLSAPYMAFAERRVVVHGAIDASMQMYRTLQIVEKFLFPAALLQRITKRLPVLSRQDRLIRARLYASLGPLLVTSLRR